MKDFLIIANKNVITLKDVFPYVKNGIVKAGYTTPNNFLDGNGNITTTLNGLCRWFTTFGNIGWFTTMPVHKQKALKLTKTYKGNEDKYPKYDNYDAINVDRVKDIPMDYDGVMGVPLGYLDNQIEGYEVIWQASGNSWKNAPGILKSIGFDETMKYGGGLGTAILNGKPKYTRIMIRKI